MPDTMIQRVAVAIREEIASPAPDNQWILEEGFREADHFLEIARIVLTAMREPSEAMTKAGLDAAGGDGSCLASYEAMIASALAEEG